MSDWECAAREEHSGEVLTDLSEEGGCDEEEGDVPGDEVPQKYSH